MAQGESAGMEDPLLNSLRNALAALSLAVFRSSSELYDSMNPSKVERQTESKAGALSTNILSVNAVKAAALADQK